MTIREITNDASQNIDPRDAQLLLGYILGRERAWMLAHPEEVVAVEAADQFRALVKRRQSSEPVQYLTGVQEFYGLALQVTPDVLIPRPETELLVEQVELWATQFHDGRLLEVADVGTGSGAIAIALATHVAGMRVTAVDISHAALSVAKENARRHGCYERTDFLENDLLTGMAAKTFDAVVSNPPYIPGGDLAGMQPEVARHEPHGALFAGVDGLDVYRRLIPQASNVLKPHGLLAMEFGFGQKESLAALLASWKNVRFLNDYAGIPRVVLAER